MAIVRQSFAELLIATIVHFSIKWRKWWCPCNQRGIFPFVSKPTIGRSVGLSTASHQHRLPIIVIYSIYESTIFTSCTSSSVNSSHLLKFNSKFKLILLLFHFVLSFIFFFFYFHFQKHNFPFSFVHNPSDSLELIESARVVHYGSHFNLFLNAAKRKRVRHILREY